MLYHCSVIAVLSDTKVEQPPQEHPTKSTPPSKWGKVSQRLNVQEAQPRISDVAKKLKDSQVREPAVLIGWENGHKIERQLLQRPHNSGGFGLSLGPLGIVTAVKGVAAREGVKVGDTLRAVDQTAVEGPEQAWAMLSVVEPGATVDLDLLRGTRPAEIEGMSRRSEEAETDAKVAVAAARGVEPEPEPESGSAAGPTAEKPRVRTTAVVSKRSRQKARTADDLSVAAVANARAKAKSARSRAKAAKAQKAKDAKEADADEEDV